MSASSYANCLIPTASEAEWLDARRKGITASEIAAVMGLSSYSSPYKLYHQKLGNLPADDDNPALERGRVLEPYIADKYAALHPESRVLGTGRELYAHPERDWQMATPDRMLHLTLFDSGDPVGYYLQPDSVLECKSDGGSDEWGEPGTDEIPIAYRCQALWQCRVMGVPRAVVACLRIRDWRLLEYEIVLDDAAVADLALMEAEALEFLDRLATSREPEVDWHPATAAAIRGLHPAEGEADVEIPRRLVIFYRAALRRFDAAEKRRDEMANKVLAAIGDGRRAVDARTREPVATRSVSHPKRVSASMVRERYPAIAAECTPDPKPVIKLLPKQKKETKTS